ncbi:DJ-1/PfpI family protein [Pseudodesulfovibrio methanolicus]|uniref:DJ-1/PfpI family protein n=1 Tax=Pseudodesulfovibrio methanolicus TaxID=3126690 RepID=A0ABZ2IZT9_9BACT
MQKVAIILTQGFADWEYGLIAGAGGPFYGLDIRFFTPVPGEIRSMGGLSAAVPDGLESIPEWGPGVIAVIGGTIWETDDAPVLDGLLLAHHSKGGIVAGICGGTLALARAGLLDDVRHTSNDADYLHRHAPGYAGSKFFRPEPEAVTDNRVITAPGTAPVGFAAAIFASAGLDRDAAETFRKMLAAEHTGTTGD